MFSLSEINNKMLYYGEEQELDPEEISEKLVLAQKMLEEIRRRPPFLTQRELVDAEADEAHERRCLRLLADTCLVTSTFFVGHVIRQPMLDVQSWGELIVSSRNHSVEPGCTTKIFRSRPNVEPPGNG